MNKPILHLQVLIDYLLLVRAYTTQMYCKDKGEKVDIGKEAFKYFAALEAYDYKSIVNNKVYNYEISKLTDDTMDIKLYETTQLPPVSNSYDIALEMKVYIGKYDLPMDKGTPVYNDNMVFYSLKTQVGQYDFRGALLRLTANLNDITTKTISFSKYRYNNAEQLVLKLPQPLQTAMGPLILAYKLRQVK